MAARGSSWRDMPSPQVSFFHAYRLSHATVAAVVNRVSEKEITARFGKHAIDGAVGKAVKRDKSRLLFSPLAKYKTGSKRSTVMNFALLVIFPHCDSVICRIFRWRT